MAEQGEAGDGSHRRPARLRSAWLLVVVLVLAAAVAGGRRAWGQPLGPRLVRPAEARAVAAAGSIFVPMAPAAPPAVSGLAAAGAPARYAEPPDAGPSLAQRCGGAASLDLLVIGSDTRAADYTSGRADFIRAVRVDPALSSVRLLALPRDLYVSIPLNPERPLHDRLSAAFAYGHATRLPAGGPSLLAAALHDNLALSFDHYVVVNFHAFIAGIDAIGGVDLHLEQPLDGSRQGLRSFPAGPQHLDGAALLDYVRLNLDTGDSGRAERQDQVIRAIRARLLQPGVVQDLPGLALALSRLILTDLSPAQMTQLACVAQHLPEAGLVTLRLGPPAVVPHTTSAGARVLLADMEQVTAIVLAFLHGSAVP